MKNIYILPTDKPSMLQLQMNGNLHIENGQSIALRSYQNIYITSDEKFKDGDWVMSLYTDTPQKISKSDFLDEEYYKKIILTTDQDLIKDGVQAIDDEFLQWFVKNPSCEEVEVEEIEKYKSTTYDQPDKFIGYDYKIIIPKEEIKKDCELEGSVDVNSYTKNEILNIIEFVKHLKYMDGSKTQCEYTPMDIFEQYENILTLPPLPYEYKPEDGLELVEIAEKIADNFDDPSFKAGVIYGVIEGFKLNENKIK